MMWQLLLIFPKGILEIIIVSNSAIYVWENRKIKHFWKNEIWHSLYRISVKYSITFPKVNFVQIWSVRWHHRKLELNNISQLLATANASKESIISSPKSSLEWVRKKMIVFGFFLTISSPFTLISVIWTIRAMFSACVVEFDRLLTLFKFCMV